MVTSCPPRTSAGAKLFPTNPVPPVMKIFMSPCLLVGKGFHPARKKSYPLGRIYGILNLYNIFWILLLSESKGGGTCTLLPGIKFREFSLRDRNASVEGA
jgi:hypothetical protein